MIKVIIYGIDTQTTLKLKIIYMLLKRYKITQIIFKEELRLLIFERVPIVGPINFCNHSGKGSCVYSGTLDCLGNICGKYVVHREYKSKDIRNLKFRYLIK